MRNEISKILFLYFSNVKEIFLYLFDYKSDTKFFREDAWGGTMITTISNFL